MKNERILDILSKLNNKENMKMIHEKEIKLLNEISEECKQKEDEQKKKKRQLEDIRLKNKKRRIYYERRKESNEKK